MQYKKRGLYIGLFTYILFYVDFSMIVKVTRRVEVCEESLYDKSMTTRAWRGEAWSRTRAWRGEVRSRIALINYRRDSGMTCYFNLSVCIICGRTIDMR